MTYALTCARCGLGPPSASLDIEWCRRCRHVRYCSRDCRSSDYERHEAFCDALRDTCADSTIDGVRDEGDGGALGAEALEDPDPWRSAPLEVVRRVSESLKRPLAPEELGAVATHPRCLVCGVDAAPPLPKSKTSTAPRVDDQDGGDKASTSTRACSAVEKRNDSSGADATGSDGVGATVFDGYAVRPQLQLRDGFVACDCGATVLCAAHSCPSADETAAGESVRSSGGAIKRLESRLHGARECSLSRSEIAYHALRSIGSAISDAFGEPTPFTYTAPDAEPGGSSAAPLRRFPFAGGATTFSKPDGWDGASAGAVRDPAVCFQRWARWFTALRAKTEFVKTDPLVRLASERLSVPVTLLSCASPASDDGKRAKLSPRIGQILGTTDNTRGGDDGKRFTELCVHVIGPSALHGGADGSEWEFLLHLCPRLKGVEVTFFGAPAGTGKAPRTVKLCDEHTARGRYVRSRLVQSKMSYADYCRIVGTAARGPDVVVVADGEYGKPSFNADWHAAVATGADLILTCASRDAAVRCAAIVTKSFKAPLTSNPVVNPCHGAVPRSTPLEPRAFRWHNLFVATIAARNNQS